MSHTKPGFAFSAAFGLLVAATVPAALTDPASAQDDWLEPVATATREDDGADEKSETEDGAEVIEEIIGDIGDIFEPPLPPAPGEDPDAYCPRIILHQCCRPVLQ